MLEMEKLKKELEAELEAERAGRLADHSTIQAMFFDLKKVRQYLSGNNDNFLRGSIDDLILNHSNKN